MTEYSVEEVRSRFEAAMSKEGYLFTRDGDAYEETSMKFAWLAYQAAYAERIKADEGVAVAFTTPSGDVVFRPGRYPGNGVELFTRPPAQVDRARETPRRQQAVETLLELGWAYNADRGWEEPAQAGHHASEEARDTAITDAYDAEHPFITADPAIGADGGVGIDCTSHSAESVAQGDVTLRDAAEEALVLLEQLDPQHGMTTQLREALAAQPRALPGGMGEAEYFAADPAEGEFSQHKTLMEAEAAAGRMLSFAQDAATEDGWPDEPPQICYGIVLGGCVEKEGSRRPAPEGGDFTETVDFRLTAPSFTTPPAQPAERVVEGWMFTVTDDVEGSTWLTIKTPAGTEASLSCKTRHTSGETICAQVLHYLRDDTNAAAQQPGESA